MSIVPPRSEIRAKPVNGDLVGNFAPKAERELEKIKNKVYLRLALYKTLVEFKGDHRRRPPTSKPVVEARRDFLDSFAYLCDVRKGGSTTTAAALQQCPDRNILWLAANEGIRRDVLTYANRILSCLRSLSSDNAANTRKVLYDLAIEHCSARIEFYRTEMQRFATRCRMQLRYEEKSEEVSTLRKRLKKLAEPSRPLTNAALVDICYAMRGAEVAEMRKWSKAGNSDFQQLAHYIGRLGSVRSSVNALVDGVLAGALQCPEHPTLDMNTRLGVIEAADPLKVKLDESDLSPYEIVRNICQDSGPRNPLEHLSALQHLVELDLPSSSNTLREALIKEKTFVTRVHAEMLIADKFSRQGFSFVDNDKYIGCSKPACYFCSNWLTIHMHDYAAPATHQKVILGCSGLDNSLNEAGHRVQREQYTKMSAQLGQDILAFLLQARQGWPRKRGQHQSTEGSSYAQSRQHADDDGSEI